MPEARPSLTQPATHPAEAPPASPGARSLSPPSAAPGAASAVALPVDLALFGVAIAARGRPGRTGAHEAAWTVLHLGAADDEHGRANAVDLLAALRRDGQPARLRLVGPLPQSQRGRLLERATAAGVVGALHLAGDRVPHEVARMLVEAALLVVPAPAGAATRSGPEAREVGTAAVRDLVAVILAGCAAGTPALAPDLPALRPLAAELPELCLVSPDLSVEAWARAASVYLPVPPAPDERWAALGRLRRSSFCLDRPALAAESR